MTYPFASLPENLAAFCGVLRREHRFRIGPRELMDAARGLELTDIADERQVRDVLRPILSKTHDDATRFDTAFDRFFRGLDVPTSMESPLAAAASESPAREGDAGSRETRPSTRGTPESDLVRPAGTVGIARELPGSEERESAALLRASYSPLGGEGASLVIEPPTRAWVDAAAALVRRTHTARSRRWHAAARGARFDFRRTLRTSLRTAGEPVVPRWRAHPRRRSRFVVLIDGSRSMGAAALPAVQTAVALTAVNGATETFTFSTRLRRITRDVRRAAAGQPVTLALEQAWGGGTTIGPCVEDFLRRFAERLLGPDTVVIVASDGLDVGSPDVLRHAMQRLARRSAAIVWINPLLHTPGYEPTAIGMSLARPHVTLLASVADPLGLRALAGTLRVD